MSSPNYPLIAEVLRSLRDHPDHHDQSSWVGITASKPEDLQKFTIKHEIVNGKDFLVSEGSCQTSACIAGWTLLHEGFKVSDPHGVGIGGNRTIFRGFTSPEGDSYDLYSVGDLAAERLGPLSWQNDFSQLFMDMEEDRAISQLMYLYDHGRLPKMEVYDEYGNPYTEEEFNPDEDMDMDARFVFAGMESDEFVSVQMKRFREAFPYVPPKEKVDA